RAADQHQRARRGGSGSNRRDRCWDRRRFRCARRERLRLRHLGGVGACRSGCGVGEAAYAQGRGGTRVCATVLISSSRERENGGRGGSTTFTAITHKFEQWRAKPFFSFSFISLFRLFLSSVYF